MRKSPLSKILLTFAIGAVAFGACKKDDPSFLTIPPVPDQSFVEEFDTVAKSFERGWVPINNSNPKGSSVWSQGGAPLPFFAPYSSNGTYAGFIAADYLSTSGTDDVISNWLISPVVMMQNGDKITFYTRTLLLPNAFTTGDSTDYGNNLEVCINTLNEGTNVGVANDPKDPAYNGATDRGDFSLVLTINPAIYNSGAQYWEYPWAHSNSGLYEPNSFPADWTKFEVIVSGLSSPRKGRFAFRYYTLDGGSNGNGSAVGIDQVTYTSKQ
ncbi:MAG: choice-of-anchor J domain-containing protein [Chitinophagaceae bacterium]|nr:choice-of-anchor J domain-containing protein [Chitinophagaceae bacterium]